MTRASAPAKVNLALVVGGRRDDGKHAVTTVLQRIDLCDRIALERSDALTVKGFAPDTLVRRALVLLAEAGGVQPRWRATIDKSIPVSAGLGGGSSDAATALRLANATLPAPLDRGRLHAVAAAVGADVPFFLADGPQIGEADGTVLSRASIPQDFWVVLLAPRGEAKPSTGAVYERFDARRGGDGYEERRARLLSTLAAVRRPRDLAALPPNDLASSPLAEELRSRGAFRADVSGAGPAVYGLFANRAQAADARRALAPLGRVWTTVPAWYG
jgi:4-diphosphocytidyl-2-C-methyl-D-erythritol kinase